MITRRSLFGLLGALPFAALLPFLKEKEGYQAIGELWSIKSKYGELTNRSIGTTPPKPDVIVEGDSFFSITEEGRDILGKYYVEYDHENLAYGPEWLQGKLVEEGLVVESHSTDEEGTLRKEIRYRL